MQITVTRDTFRLAEVFTISRGAKTEAKVLTVRVTVGVTGMCWAPGRSDGPHRRQRPRPASIVASDDVGSVGGCRQRPAARPGDEALGQRVQRGQRPGMVGLTTHRLGA